MEFSGDESQLPLNTKHCATDYGVNAYLTNDYFPYAYMTLTDHFVNRVPPLAKQEHKDFFSRFPTVGEEVNRRVHGPKGNFDVPIYAAKDMKLALGLHLIEFLRDSRDTELKEFCLNKDLDDRQLDKVLNFVFQPEFHVPRLVSTNNFKKVKLRDMTMKEAIIVGDFGELSTHLKSKEDAIKAMDHAVRNSKKEAVEHILSMFEFTKDDARKISDKDEVEYLLSDYDADHRILEIFLERGLVDPNYVFQNKDEGSTMLDNARLRSNLAAVKILLKYGALHSNAYASRYDASWSVDT
ncbi:OspC family protein [Streptomyces cavourensis]|nr:OspC family protein [Streptomyces cavourensis]